MRSTQEPLGPEDKNTYGEGVETLLPRSVPDFITQHAVFESALLSQEGGTDCRLLVGLEFIGNLEGETPSVDGESLKDTRLNEQNARRLMISQQQLHLQVRDVFSMSWPKV